MEWNQIRKELVNCWKTADNSHQLGLYHELVPGIQALCVQLPIYHKNIIIILSNLKNNIKN